MGYDDQIYHRERERQCRSMARRAADPDVRRRHEELAQLHAGRAETTTGMTDTGGQPGAG
jgi:hypothetical protein